MTEQYTFSGDRPLISTVVIDENVEWASEDAVHSMGYSDGANSTLEDTMNESYGTAVGDNTTQYLSVLETSNEMTLDNLNISLANPKVETDENVYETEQENAVDETGDNEQQMVLFTLEGSDDFYGVQLAQDEEGNIRKYQFKFRQLENGQYEAIPESIQIISEDEDVDKAVEADGQDDDPLFDEPDTSNEHILPDHLEDDDSQDENQMQIEEEEITILYEKDDEDIDEKTGILESIKQEKNIVYHTDESLDQNDEFEEYCESHDNENYEHVQEQTYLDENNGNHIQYQEVPTNKLNDNYEEQSENDEINYSFKIVKHDNKYLRTSAAPHDVEDIIENNAIEDGTNMIQIQPAEETETYLESGSQESDNEDYQIIEGLHVTGDVEDESLKSFTNTNILRDTLKSVKENKINKENKLLYLIVKHPEKENVNALSFDKKLLYKPTKNPRSILKSSHPIVEAKNTELLVYDCDERLGKRFARGKEAMQARIFHNFINKTTIPQAPVRKIRLPRKQKIKPVERMDEEIVVKEVMVSNNGFVDADYHHKNDDNHEVTAYVELTDSDEDYLPKKEMRKMRKHKKRIEIMISDDDDDDDDDDDTDESIIELDIVDTDDESDKEKDKDSEESDESEPKIPVKRRRGRPPKVQKEQNEQIQVVIDKLESPLKKIRMDTEDSDRKTEVSCPKCPKTFASQNSLKTHLQHHNLENTILLRSRRAASMATTSSSSSSASSSSSSSSLLPKKYKCPKCENSFKNNFLLSRHACAKKTLDCSVCKKKFNDLSTLNMHKRSHVKEQLIKSTTIAKVSPKKVLKAPIFKQPMKAGMFKCKVCGKICSSQMNLNVHSKSHKEYKCQTCSSTFMSRIMLETHVREKCVKTKSPNRRSLRINKSVTPEIGQSNVSPAAATATAAGGGSMLKLSCEECSMLFQTYKGLFNHKVIKHGHETPDKSIFNKQTKKFLHKPKGAHAGVLATQKLRVAYAHLKSKQMELGN